MQSTCHNSKNPSEDADTPLPFSKSKAGVSKSASNLFGGGGTATNEDPWYQSLSISASIGALLIWFCVLREENDLDSELNKTLYERVDGMEKKQLELALEHGQGLDTRAIQKRLDEINANR